MSNDIEELQEQVEKLEKKVKKLEGDNRSRKIGEGIKTAIRIIIFAIIIYYGYKVYKLVNTNLVKPVSAIVDKISGGFEDKADLSGIEDTLDEIAESDWFNSLVDTFSKLKKK